MFFQSVDEAKDFADMLQKQYPNRKYKIVEFTGITKYYDKKLSDPTRNSYCLSKIGYKKMKNTKPISLLVADYAVRIIINLLIFYAGWVAAHYGIARECERLSGFFVGKDTYICTNKTLDTRKET